MALQLWLPGAKKFSKKYPTSFVAEKEYLEACFKGLPSLRPIRRQGLRLLEKLTAAHDARSHVVHGFMRNWDKKTKRLAFMRVMKLKNEEPQMVIFSVSEAGLVRDAKRVATLCDTAYKFTLRLDKICIPKKDSQEALGSLY